MIISSQSVLTHLGILGESKESHRSNSERCSVCIKEIYQKGPGHWKKADGNNLQNSAGFYSELKRLNFSVDLKI